MADTDLLSYEEGRRVIREVGTSATNGALLTAAIAGVSLALDKKCGPIVQRALVENHDGGCDTIWLDEWPVTAVSSVVQYDAATPTTLTAHTNGSVSATTYHIGRYSQPSAPYSGQITRPGSTFPDGNGNVVVSFTGGRFASTGAVTEDFKAAARITLENWWQQYRDGAGRMDEYEVPISAFPRFDVPRAALNLLGDEVHQNRDDRPDVLVG